MSIKDIKETELEEIDQTEVFKCDSCGSSMVFNPETQTLKCVHCGSKVSFKNEIANELNLSEGLSQDKFWERDKNSCFRCESCGAQVVFAVGESAKKCPFCLTSHVVKEQTFLGLKPNAVVPFSFDVKKGVLFSKNWAKKRFFAPRNFKKNINCENVSGVYAPNFTFDSATTSYYVGEIGKTHTRVIGSGKNRRVETYVVWRKISGTYNTSFDDVLISAGDKLGQKELDKISPFSTNESKVYNETYLSGYMAYQYDNELSLCWGQAKQRMDKVIKRNILSKYSYDKLAYINVSTKHTDVKYKYVMLPVYVGSYTFKKRNYNFYVNGSTGKVYGKTPKSIFKIFLTIALGVCTLAGIILLSTM